MSSKKVSQQLLEIAKRAAQESMKFFQKPDLVVEIKEDNSPVSEGDIATNQVIEKGLREEFPEIPIISEESRIPALNERQSWSQFFLVDPIDGTKEYIRGSDEFTVNIGLIENGVPVAGVIVAPAMKLSYWASKEDGAFKEENGKSESIQSTLKTLDDELVCIDSRSYPTKWPAEFSARIKIKKTISAASSLKFGKLAEAKVDLYPRFSRAMEWDVAAGDAIWRWSSDNGSPRFSPIQYNTPGLDVQAFVLGAGAEELNEIGARLIKQKTRI